MYQSLIDASPIIPASPGAPPCHCVGLGWSGHPSLGSLDRMEPSSEAWSVRGEALFYFLTFLCKPNII